jgi:hypothetical protein
MERPEADALLDALLEELAALEHERWAHWQKYVHEQGELQTDGSLLIPSEKVRRWQEQIETKYADLSEAEKDSDREQVRRYAPLIASALAGNDNAK